MGDCNSTTEDHIRETRRDYDIITGLALKQVKSCKGIDCRYQYYYDSGEYMLLKCRHKKMDDLCIGKLCKHKKPIQIATKRSQVKECMFYSPDTKYPKTSKRYYKCCANGAFYEPCELYYGIIKKCKNWRSSKV